jgi:GT2 family glycosyltransferase/glycosyltransferase involved in cell wall biosynthesis
VRKLSDFISKLTHFRRRLSSSRGGQLERFSRLKNEFDQSPSLQNEHLLSELLDTTSPIADVLEAMRSQFDASHYVSTYADVRRSGVDPQYHYLFWGWKESRTPTKYFDPVYYRDHNEDLGEKDFPLAHYLRYGLAAGKATNPVSNRLWLKPAAPAQGDWGRLNSAKCTSSTRAVVIVPVYKGYDETLTSIWQALESRGSDQYSLLVINDASPDSELASMLRRLGQDGLFDYHESDTNRGFVKTINYAIEKLSGELDVVLLNSDAYVFTGWFSRLIQHADDDESVATVTPLSNNATICSYPLYDADNYKQLELTPSELDFVAATANKGQRVEAPTGVGFCFYMRRAVIEEIGALDAEAFKLGYGEENDFCMRAIAAGYKNVIAGDVFVYHTGSVSFSAVKEENFQRGQINLELKHPHYPATVKNHIVADPERLLRRNLDAERLVQSFRGSVLFVTHRWSGGIETYIRHLSAKLEREGRRCLILRVHDRCRVSFEDCREQGVYLPNLSDIDLRSAGEFLQSILDRLQLSLVHVNSFAGLEWHFQQWLMSILTEYGVPRVLVGHDYSPITHHYQLLRPDNVFVGVPTAEDLAAWDLMALSADCVDVCPAAIRRQAYRRFFDGGTRLEVPSNVVRDIYAQFYPDIEINVTTHDDHLPPTAASPRPLDDDVLRVAVIGAIGPHKGSDVVAALAADAKNRRLPISYYLVGFSNQDELLRDKGVVVGGRYRSEHEAMLKVDLIQPHLCIVPSVWPETYCYTLSMILKKRIPPIVFDLGAQAERVRAINWGATLPLHLINDPSALSDAILAIDVKKLWDLRGN